MVTLDDLLKRAASFVEKQKGRWDDEAWRGLVADVRKKGLELSGDVEHYFGAALESMKRLHGSASQHDLGRGASDVLHGVSAHAAKFVEQTRGTWDHAGWEEFLKGVQQKGIRCTAEVTPAVGEVLEATKRIYHALPFVGGAEPAKPSAAKQGAPKPSPTGEQAGAAAPAVVPTASPSAAASPAPAGGLKKVPSKSAPAAAPKAAATGNGAKAPAAAASKPLKASPTKESAKESAKEAPKAEVPKAEVKAAEKAPSSNGAGKGAGKGARR